MSGRARTLSRGRSQALDISQPAAPGAAADIPATSQWGESRQLGVQPPQPGTQQQPPRGWSPQLRTQQRPPRGWSPQLGTQVRPPRGWSPQPETQVRPPRGWSPQPGTQVRPPRGWSPQPGTQLRPPRAGPPQPGTQLRPPRAGPPQPGTQLRPPRAGPPQPGTQLRPPRAGPPQPGTQLRPPRAGPPQPGTQLRPPRAGPPQPGVQLRPPRAGPPQPGVQLRPPRAGPPQPGVQLRPPRAGPPQACARPLQPTAQNLQQLPVQSSLPGVLPPEPQAQPSQTWAQLVKSKTNSPQARTQPPQPHVQPPLPAAQLPQTHTPSPQSQREGQAVASEESRGAEGRILLPEHHPTAITKKLTQRPCGGIFQDIVVNTRKDMKHVKDSKTGTGGEVIKLQTNHYPVTCGHEIAYKYNIDYQPDIKDMAIRTDLLLRHKSILGNCHIFDGNSLLLPRRLQHLEMELVSQTESDGKVRIRIRLSSELHPNHPEWLRYYNILFSKLLKLNNIEEMDSNPRDLRDLRNLLQASRMDIKRSYTTSILPYEKSLTLCADVTHRLLQKKTVWDLIAEKNDSVTKEEEVFEEVVGSIVYTSYNNKTYRIDDVKWEKKPKDTFDKFDGSKTTYIDYYMKRYNTSITELGQPLLMSLGKWKKGQTSTPQEPIFLVPQLCYLTGVPRAVSENHSLMAQLTDRMRMSPVNRRIALNNFMNDIQTNQNIKNEFLQWKVTFDGNSLSVPGRVLSSVKLFQGARSYTVKPHLQNWLRDSKNIALHRAKSLDRWVILHTRSCSSQANRLVSTLEKVTEKMNIKMSRAARHQVNEDPGSFRQALQKHISKDTQMVVCVLPDNRKQRYEEIKTFLCVENPVPSQCVVASTLNNERNLTTIVTKIAQQMNCKMGGALWKVDTRMEKTMFIGIDCFHDIVSRQKSVAAFVASTKEDLTMWYSQCLFQDTAEEIVNDLQSCLQGALNSWVANEKQKPQSVVVYRDGVGDGQLQALLEKEVRQFQKFFTSSIKLTFIVVKKRINTRFFVENGDEVTNPPSGTVVDQIVTRKEWYDFYIVSQTSNSGTVTPTHYNVIYDTKGLTPNQVQCLTYRLCHMYYNLPGIIRVPAPCHYAHRLAYFVGKSIHQKPASSLSDYLYYL